MGNSVVKVGNSEIQVSDNRAASIIKGGSFEISDVDAVVRLDDNCVSYAITNHDARRLLAHDLHHVIAVVFKELPDNRTRIHQQREYLEEAVGLLAKDLVETLLVRQETIQYYLNEFFTQMQEIVTYSKDYKSSIWELMIARSLKKFIKNMNNATNRSVTLTEFPKLAQIAEVDADSLRFIIDFSPLASVTGNYVSDGVREVFGHKELEAANTADKRTSQMKRTDLLHSLSPDALNAFTDTELLIVEVTPLATTPEDEYFIEQIEKDYYPHIFDSLKQFEGSAIDFQDKETVVLESIKQFKIIQLGLQKIIDNTVARKLTTIKSQTDFLRNKVLGEKSLSLSPKEAEEEIEATLEEAQRIREGLYKKHVAPVLEQNKNDYDAALVLNREEYNEELVQNKASYEKLAGEQKADFDKQVSFYREENLLQKTNFDEQLAQQKTNFDDQLAAIKKELVSSYKKELAMRTDGYKKSIRALKNQHSAEIASLEEDNARVLGKYHELLSEAKDSSQSSLDEDYEEMFLQHEEAYDRLEKESADKLHSYKAQIAQLKCEIDRLESLTISFISQDAPPLVRRAEEEETLVVVQEEINEAKQVLDSMKSKPATIWDNGQRLLTSDEMRDESYWSESYFDET
jgi:hypothetical protein